MVRLAWVASVRRMLVLHRTATTDLVSLRARSRRWPGGKRQSGRTGTAAGDKAVEVEGTRGRPSTEDSKTLQGEEDDQERSSQVRVGVGILSALRGGSRVINALGVEKGDRTPTDRMPGDRHISMAPLYSTQLLM